VQQKSAEPANQAAALGGGVGRWSRVGHNRDFKVADMCIRCREFSDVHVSKIGQARSLHLPMQNRPTALQPFCVSILIKCRVWPSLGFVVSLKPFQLLVNHFSKNGK
jgi:hypothetical protein